MKARFLKPGQRVKLHGREMVFEKRLRHGREVSGRTVNVFTCADYVGLDGPKDAGRCEVSDPMFAVLSGEAESRG